MKNILYIINIRVRNMLPTSKAPDLIILDDLFPHTISAFRTAEYTALLCSFPQAIVWTTGASLSYIKEVRSLDTFITEFNERNPTLHDKVRYLHPYQRLRGRLAYITFLHNAYTFVGQLEISKIPFVLQLYPGGTFRLYDTESDLKLTRICKSPYLRHIIVTQVVVYDYLINQGFCRPDQLTLIYGVVVPLDVLEVAAKQRLLYPHAKDTYDVCFVGAKYMVSGRDKGYDLFIEVAQQMVSEFENLRFHVIGPYDANDYPIAGLENRLRFYGSQRTEFFPDFYARMDAIISPNRSNTLAPGAFDGFPVGCCVEAGACGVTVFCTDDLNQNIVFRDGYDIVLVPPDAQAIANRLRYYLTHYDELQIIGKRGSNTINQVFSLNSQIAPRVAILRTQLNPL